MPLPRQSESDRCAPWGGARDFKMKPMRPTWETPSRFLTDHGIYVIVEINPTTFGALYTAVGDSELRSPAVAEGGVLDLTRQFTFTTRHLVWEAIKAHHKNTLKAIRLSKKI